MADAAAVTEAGAAIALHYRVWRTDFRVTVASPAIAGYVQLLCGQFGTKPARDAVELEVAAGPADGSSTKAASARSSAGPSKGPRVTSSGAWWASRLAPSGG